MRRAAGARRFGERGRITAAYAARLRLISPPPRRRVWLVVGLAQTLAGPSMPATAAKIWEVPLFFSLTEGEDAARFTLLRSSKPQAPSAGTNIDRLDVLVATAETLRGQRTCGGLMEAPSGPCPSFTSRSTMEWSSNTAASAARKARASRPLRIRWS